ncbi:MAG TPA: hypothetical protein PKY77_20205 [Phycisphaerae bacterium]|nr:hypothetical protein [Phycisphaerae bacterium]HRY71069.1 hypothetical protein [Phycisphaerae bacterium]HSA29159.1 hypothetical protein [Phycisphaerae bacterium]
MPANKPSYRHHKPSDQAVVTIDGKDFYLGPYDTPESRSKYDRLIAMWLAGGRCERAASSCHCLSEAVRTDAVHVTGK